MNHERITRLLVAGVLAVATALALAWFLRNFELATREEKSGYSREALRNPLLAAERLLTQLGVEAASVAYTDLWRRMPGADDTLLIYRYQPPVGEERRRQLRAWVESGGHLIVAADATLDTAGPAPSRGLLAELGVRRVKAEPPPKERQATLDLKFTNAEAPVKVAFATRYWLEEAGDEAVVRVPLGNGYALLQYELGDGLVTVVSDNGFLSNGRIADHDHALALALLVGAPGGGKVWLAHDIEMPSLLALAWERLPQAIAAAAVAIVLWLWYLGTRLGPLLPAARPPRRDIGEHLAATGHYYWRLERARRLYLRNRDQVLQAWLARHYLLRNLAPEERHAWIAARSGLSARAVERALAGEFANEADFVELSSCLQKLRSGL